MLINGKRALAYIQVIEKLTPIDGADRIELAHVLGWQSVVRRGEFHVGDKVVYLEIDSWVPSSVASFLDTPTTKEYNGVRGNKLRTVRLRGALSQGLILPIGDYLSVLAHDVGDDVTELLGIQKWEPPLDLGNSGVIGSWDYRVPKTDQERCQNLDPEFWKGNRDEFTYEVTEKCDGQSITLMYDGALQERIKVFSRNNEISVEPWMQDLLQPFRGYLQDHPTHVFQCELIGPKIQGNPYKLTRRQLLTYDVFDVSTNQYMTPSSVLGLCQINGIPHVPVIFESALRPESSNEALWVAEGESLIRDTPDTASSDDNKAPPREGLVWKRNSPDRMSFKAVSNAYLMGPSNGANRE